MAQAQRPPRRTAPDGSVALRTGLIRWFRAARRDLPWRRNRDPYRVWISEAMLQQTRVEAVVPYFERFVARFPNVDALAAAAEEDVVAAWSGLGYYRRARALHAAARSIVAVHGGRFPSTRAALTELAGIGPYTAGAILSIAFDQPEALVDGNVARVLARLFATHEDAWPLARALADPPAPAPGEAHDAFGPGTRAEWSEALMELGATVCLPREPRCGACPVRDACRARESGTVPEFPRPRARPAPLDVELRVYLVEEDGRVLLERRPSDGRMAGMWQLPTVEPSGAGLLHPAGIGWREAASVLDERPDEGWEVRHTITRHRIRAHVVPARWIGGEIQAPLGWNGRDALERLALTGLSRKALRAAATGRER